MKVRERVKKRPYNVFPKQEYVFRPFFYFNEENCKVIIVGQDPYPTAGHATGIAFGTNSNSIPRSLRHIKQAVENDVGKMTSDPTLLPWVKQGVCLMNSALTVEEGRPNSHRNLWLDFTYDNLERWSRVLKNVVFVFWGSSAKAFKLAVRYGAEKNGHLILDAEHPVNNSFPKCTHFSQINKFLIEHNKKPIIW